MEYKNINVEKKGRIALLTLNREERLNALGRDMIDEMKSAIGEISSDKSCRALVIRGAGERAFCAGGDINYLNSLSGDDDVGRFVESLRGVMVGLESMDKPTIAAIEGYCLGGGLELALACDIRISGKGSVFGLPEVGLGIMPGGGGTYRLPRIVGLGIANELIFTAKRIGESEALRIGLVNAVVEKGKAEEAAMGIARDIARNSMTSVSEAKKAVYSNITANYAAEKAGFERCFREGDKAEGMQAFLEKRKPDFGE